MRILSFIPITAILLQSAVASQVFAEGEKIAEISVTGNRRIETQVILNAIKLKVGDTVLGDKINEDLRSIYNLGHFLDVRVSTEDSSHGTTLIYSVLEKPAVREIRFQGNKALSTDKLNKDALELSKGAVFSTKDLNKSVAKIRRLYENEGYYLAQVTSEVRRYSPTDVGIIFKIVEGDKIFIKKISFDGNKVFSDRKLRKVMQTRQKNWLSWITNAGAYRDEMLKNDALILADHYMNNGYINVKVGEPVVTLNDSKDALHVMVGITEGEQYRINKIDFEGDLMEPISVLRKKLKSEPGAIFSRAIIRDDIVALTDLYGDKGYAFANINPLTKQDNEKKTLDIVFDMERGELVHIGKISVSGNAKTRDKVIRREMRITETGLYSATGLKRSKQNLMNTDYFQEANISTTKGSDASTLDVNVDVKEKSTGAFSIGGGYSSFDGIVGQGSISQNNFLGMGLKANFSLSIGGKSQTYSLGVTEPYFLDTKWSLGGDIYRTSYDYIDYSRRATGFGIRGGYTFNDFMSAFLMYRFEIRKLYDPEPAYKILNKKDPVNFPLDSTTTSSVMASFSHNNTDYHMQPSTGFINNFSVELAGLGGDSRFAKFTTDHTWFYPIYKNSVVFSTRLSFGYIKGIGRPIPIDDKFYLGGINSLRGYETRTVSPIKSELITTTTPYTTDVVYLGADKQAYGNTEITFPILAEQGIRGLVFFDYGNAANDFSKLFNPIQMSFGGGVRWNSPMGPLRLEYGIPINPRHGIDKSSGRFEFSMGRMF